MSEFLYEQETPGYTDKSRWAWGLSGATLTRGLVISVVWSKGILPLESQSFECLPLPPFLLHAYALW